MDLWQAIGGRVSVRAFDPARAVSDEEMTKILEAAIRAPSAGNLQPWTFHVIRKPETRAALAGAAFGQSFVSQAPVVVVVCVEPERSATRYGDRGRRLYCLQDAAAAIAHLQLAAVALGLGTCWVGAFDEHAAAEALALGPGFRPVALIPVGAPAKLASPRPRRPLSEVVRWE